MRKFGTLALAGALLAGLSLPGHAQFRDPQAAVKYRASTMVLLGAHFGRLAPVARKEAPFEQAAVQANVDVVKMLADLPWAAYAPGYEGGEARGDVWTNRDGFRKATEGFQAAVRQLDDAAQAGDFDAFRVAFGKVGQSCKACHDAFRVKK
ncbi:cytochrome c [Alcaligenaceae bacterium]|nr:cytochrome c [Alcaligenaceae bacterium]